MVICLAGLITDELLSSAEMSSQCFGPMLLSWKGRGMSQALSHVSVFNWL